MFTQIKNWKIRFASLIIFAAVFFVGSFLVKVPPAAALSISISPGAGLYTMTKTDIYLNNEVTPTSVVLIGCIPQSGDKYDMNTGKPCTYSAGATALIGCAPRSGDNFDMNTGKPCVYDNKTVFLIGCAERTGDAYNIYSGVPCAKKIISIPTKIATSKIISKTNQLIPRPKPNELTLNINPATISTEQSTGSIESNTTELSGREKIKDSLYASVVKVGSIFKGPMSIWIILLIVVIILAGGYGVYSFNFFKKNDESGVSDENKETVPAAIPKINTSAPQPTQTTNTQGSIPLGPTIVTPQSANTTPQTQNTQK